MKVFISAAEASSDRHGAKLLSSLKRQCAERGIVLEACGLGGEELRREGLEEWVSANSLSSIGFVEILGKIPRIFSILKKLEKKAIEFNPDVAVVIDYPDFHFRLAKRLSENGIPTVYYIPPKVWAWRSGRIKALRRYFRKLICIFPFERDFFESVSLPAQYVGNPVLDELPLSVTREEAREKLGIGKDEFVLALLPGSRPAELGRHFDLFLDSAKLFLNKKKKENALIRIPLPWNTDLEKTKARLQSWRESRGEKKIRVELSQGDSDWVMIASDYGIIKSGTSTLEAACLGLPHVVVYHPNPITRFIVRKVFRYLGPVGLSNLVLDRWKETFPERLGVDATPEKISDALFQWNFTERSFLEVRRALTYSTMSPSDEAALAVLEAALEGRYRLPPTRFFFFRKMGSLAWMTLNRFVRWAFHRFHISKKLSARTVSIGNIEAGGTGKTPITYQIAKDAQSRGEVVAILTRGTAGKKSEGGETLVLEPSVQREKLDPFLWGDESAWLSEELPECWIGIGKSRVKSAGKIEALSKKSGAKKPTLYLLDDGFQHFKVYRDLDVIVRTGAEPGEVWHRDSRFSIPKRSLTVWTKGERIRMDEKDPVRLEWRLDPIPHAESILVCGIGRPDALETELSQMKHRIAKKYVFTDHHPYNLEEIDSILKESALLKKPILMTEKDWVKWKFLKKDLPLLDGVEGGIHVLTRNPHFESGHEKWNKVLWG